MIHSLSKLGTFESCAAKYKFQYVDKFPRSTSASASRGVDTHAMVEQYLNSVLPDLPHDLSFYKGFLDGLKTLPEIFPEKKIALTREWKPTEWEGNETWYRGILDLLIPPTNGTIHIYDWKTGKIYDDHEEQRQIYALAAIALYPDAAEVSCTHVYLDLNDRRGRTYHRDQLEGYRERWKRRFLAVESATEFPYNPQFACRWCSFTKSNGGPCPF